MKLLPPSKAPRISPENARTLWALLLFVLRRVCDAIERKITPL